MNAHKIITILESKDIELVYHNLLYILKCCEAKTTSFYNRCMCYVINKLISIEKVNFDFHAFQSSILADKNCLYYTSSTCDLSDTEQMRLVSSIQVNFTNSSSYSHFLSSSVHNFRTCESWIFFLFNIFCVFHFWFFTQWQKYLGFTQRDAFHRVFIRVVRRHNGDLRNRTFDWICKFVGTDFTRRNINCFCYCFSKHHYPDWERVQWIRYEEMDLPLTAPN